MKQVLNGNNQSVELLERALAHAKKGSVRYVGVLLCEDPNYISLETAGASDMEEQLPDVLDRFKASIDPKVKNRTLPPPRDENLGADHACYNVASMPISFDFVPWLMVQEMRRIREKAPSPLKVGFWFGQDGESGLETNYRSQMFEHVVTPLLGLIGAIEDKKACAGVYDQAEGFSALRELVHASRAGEIAPKFKPSQWAANKVAGAFGRDPVISITLREADHWRHRNSNKPAWAGFARDLQRQGKRVVFVRDTARANEEFDDFEICPLAAVNLDIRMALYEHAQANLFVSNGCASLAFHGTKPCLMFTPLDDDGNFLAGTQRWWRDAADMTPGEQYPWTQSDQRIVWGLDTYQNISSAWEELNAKNLAA